MRRVAVIVVSAVMLVSGCTGDSEPTASASKDKAPPVANPVVTAQEMNAYPEALVAGILTIRQGCLMLGESLVVWPADTTWDEASKSVRFAGAFKGAEPVAVGMSWKGGGGYSDATSDFESLVRHDTAAEP